jgi:hypothetical protein
MPKIRIGLSTDFNLAGEQVGIGTTNPTARVDVAGQILAKNTGGSGGVSTYREYQGFHQTQSNVSNTVLIDSTDAGNLNSLSGELRIDGDVTIAPDTSVTSGKIDSLTATDKFAVPLGETNNRENTPEAGTTRFNQDFGTLEFFDGVNWKTVNSYSRGGAAGRGVFGGGNPLSSANQVIDFVNITTLGNAQNFGEMYAVRRSGSGMSSLTRGLFGGGASPAPASNDDTIDYITIVSEGNPIDFGNLSLARRNPTGASSSTRGLTAGGYVSAANDTIDYVEIATLGNALDFGNLVQASFYPSGSSSPTRAVFAGGILTGNLSTMSFVSFASKGNSVEFGDMVSGGGEISQGCSSSVRGIFTGGSGSSPYTKTIEYVTFSSLGNSIHFGELTQARVTFNASTQVRAVLAGGSTPANVNTIDYITISSSGNAQDFGDLTQPRTGAFTLSDSHGGLGGF